ncbi:MAG: beta-ketoacyl-ACP synthase III [Alphaproteobacteria bacterium]
MARSVIVATGSYLPARVVSNDELAQKIDTSDAWIRERTGIITRHLAAENETTSDMAIAAARAALVQSGLEATAIDGVVVATSTPDTTMPSVASKVQAALGIAGGPALDVAAACTGFVYALAVADGWLQSGIASKVLVIGAESMSRIIDWSDRTTSILFGDGAGAVILARNGQEKKRGILAIRLEADGKFGGILGTNGGVSTTQTAGFLFMEGQEVFRHGVEKMAGVTLDTLAKAELGLTDVTWVVAHQANARMIAAIARQLKLPSEKFIVTLDRHANTSAASIPLALDVAGREGRLKKGDIIALPALGAGLTWGCCVICW